MTMQKIRTFLWYDGNAEEAVKFYIATLGNGKIIETMPGPGDKPMGLTFELEGLEYMALNGGPQFKHTPAISLFVSCKDQQEVDRLWNAFTSGGGKESMCGWLEDKYGVSWQIIPTALMKMMGDKNPKKAQATMNAMLKMKKIIVKDLQAAYDAA